MTLEELYALREQLSAEQLRVHTQIESTDVHALKCYKLGKDWNTEYPEEAELYTTSLDRYHELEDEIAKVEAEIAEKEAEEPTEEPTGEV